MAASSGLGLRTEDVFHLQACGWVKAVSVGPSYPRSLKCALLSAASAFCIRSPLGLEHTLPTNQLNLTPIPL